LDPPGRENNATPTLDTGLEADRHQVPHFVRDWLFHDMDRPDEVACVFQSTEGTTWDTYHYDEDMQARCDHSLRTRVSPGFGGVSQELWIAAPTCIREQERVIINLILRTGLVPPILGRKQMIYLAKSDTAHGVVNLDPGLPPWRPITVQSALSSRIFTVIRDYITPCIPNHEMQHGFQRDRTVQDAAVLTALLIERAERRQEELFLISKDCLKCFNRTPGWVMEYIYRKLGVPPLPRKLMAHFLGASQIDIRTAFGWLDGGIREFGLGQGSILAVMHIGYYMDILLRQQQSGIDPVHIIHSQNSQGTRTRTIASLLFVDDALYISTSYAGIQDRARISNHFTGQSASGGVFGADKSFLLYLSPRAHPVIALNDGLGIPQPIRVVAPSEGFRHLGIHQDTDNQWEETTRAVWQRLNTQADAVAPRGLGKKELQYIVNSVWIPSVLYRTAISDAISIAPALDTLLRKTARRVLKLPHDHPTEWFYDPIDGLGLVQCERFSHSQRLYHFLRIANDSGSPTHDIAMESLEAYQLDSGLTDHPLAFRIPPPVADNTILGTMLRGLATFQPAFTITTHWQQPAASLPRRPNDRPIWAYLTPALGTTLISINRLHTTKVRWVGDITNDKGTMLLSLESLRTKFGWSRHTLQRFAPIWDAIPTAVPPTPLPALRQQTIQWAPRPAGQPLPLPLPPPLRSSLPILTHPLGRTFFVPAPGYETIHIPVHAMLVIPHHLTHQDGQPPTLSYRIGRRNSLKTRQSPAGTEIAVTFWHELRKDSDIWYSPTPREARGRHRLVSITDCAILIGNLLPTSRAQRHKFIPWTDTSWTDTRTHITHSGENNRSLIASTAGGTTDRTPSPTGHQPAQHATPACTACHRLADTTPTLLPLTNYAHLIIPDYWELRDDHDRPVTGATAPWLGAVYGRRDWPKAQARKPDTRQTIQPLRIPTGDICKWDLPALNFYWRSAAPAARMNHMVTPTFAARTDQVVAQIQLLLELPSPTPPTHVDPDPNPDLVDQPGARGASIRTSSAGHSPTSNLEYTFRGLFEALSMSAVSNQALLDRLDRTVRIEAALRVVLARLLPNRPHTMPSALRRVNEEVESLGDALKQAREEWEAEMGLQEKVEQERDQANTERDQLEERVRELQTELRTCGLLCSCSGPAARVQAAQPQEVVALLGKVRGLRIRLREAQDEAKKYKELATRVENTIQAQLSSMADQVRELDRQQRSHEEEVAEFEERYRVEVAGHREASRALATTTQRFPDVFPAFWDWVSAHFRVTSGPVYDRLLEAWVRDDPALFEDNCENLSVFAFPTRQTPLAVPILPTPTSHSGAVSYPPLRSARSGSYGIRGRGFESQLNVGGFGGSLRGGPDHKDLGYGLSWPRKHLEQCPNKSSSCPGVDSVFETSLSRYVDAVDEKGLTLRP
ncbi:hypothetical protein DYB31_008119, partial [Aphanomyces astaci]